MRTCARTYVGYFNFNFILPKVNTDYIRQAQFDSLFKQIDRVIAPNCYKLRSSKLVLQLHVIAKL